MSASVTSSGSAPAAPRALRVAVCVPSLAPLRQMLEDGHAVDGTYVVQGYIAAGLRARGHRLTFLARREPGDIECGLDPGEPRIVPRTWSTRLWFRLASSSAWRLQRRLGVPYLNVFSNVRLTDACLRCLPGHDVVYERNALYDLGVARASRRLGLPYVMFFEADQVMELEYTGRSLPRLLRWRAGQVLRYNLKAADCIICVSEPARAHLLSTWGADPRKVVVCRNGVDVGRFRPDPETRAKMRRTLGLDGCPLVVFTGSFFEWHDVATLLDAFALVRARTGDARLVLAGDGRTLESMKRRAQAAGLAKAVQFTGLMPHTEIPQLLSAADVAVAPYPRTEQVLWLSPLKLFEYMASGAAIVASDAGQVREVIRHASNGLLVPPGDAPAMAAAIEKLTIDAELRGRLGAQARQDAVHEHSWERYIDRLEAVFGAVIERSHSSGSVLGD